MRCVQVRVKGRKKLEFHGSRVSATAKWFLSMVRITLMAFGPFGHKPISLCFMLVTNKSTREAKRGFFRQFGIRKQMANQTWQKISHFSPLNHILESPLPTKCDRIPKNIPRSNWQCIYWLETSIRLIFNCMCKNVWIKVLQLLRINLNAQCANLISGSAYPNFTQPFI